MFFLYERVKCSISHAVLCIFFGTDISKEWSGLASAWHWLPGGQCPSIDWNKKCLQSCKEATLALLLQKQQHAVRLTQTFCRKIACYSLMEVFALEACSTFMVPFWSRLEQQRATHVVTLPCSSVCLSSCLSVCRPPPPRPTWSLGSAGHLSFFSKYISFHPIYPFFTSAFWHFWMYHLRTQNKIFRPSPFFTVPKTILPF